MAASYSSSNAASTNQASQLAWYETGAAAQIHEVQLQRVELLNGRAAMLGFGIGVISEALSGKGILHQVGLDTLLSQGCIRAQGSGWDPQANRGRVAQPGQFKQVDPFHTAGQEPTIPNPSPPAPSPNLPRSRQERISGFAAPYQARLSQEFGQCP
jgi:hypothetical protein